MVEWKKLISVSDVLYGYPFESSLFTEDSDNIPLIRIRDVKPAIASTYYSGQILDDYRIRRGDILVGMDGEFNLGKWNDRDGLLNQRVLKLKGKEGLCLDGFLFHYMGPVFKKIEKETAGGSVKHLSAKAINQIVIPVPPINKQEQIVDMLDAFTSSIDNLKQQIAQRRKQYEYYRDQLFDLEGKEGVEMKTLGELFSFKNGLNKGKEFFGKGRPIIMFSNVFNSRSIDASMINNRVDISDEELERINAKVGDVFFTRTSETRDDVGYASVLVQDIAECTFAGFLIRARPTTEMLLPKYCKYCFSTQKVRKTIVSNCSFTTRASLTGTGLGIISLPVPSLSEQQRIVDILDKFEASIQNLEAQLSQREKQYEYYRNKLLTFE